MPAADLEPGDLVLPVPAGRAGYYYCETCGPAMYELALVSGELCAGGFAAAGIWLKGRGVDTSAERVSLALNAQAGGDLEVCRSLRAAAGVPHLPLTGPLQAATDVLAGRWRTVLRLAYVLRRHRSIYGFEIRDILAAAPAPGVTAAYRAWSARFASQLPLPPSAAAPGATGNPDLPLSADVPAAR